MEDTAQRKVARWPGSLDELAALVEQVERGCSLGSHGQRAWVRTGFPWPLDQLARAALHEWWCGNETDYGWQPWTAPILVLAHLVRVAAENDTSSGGLAVWIGRRVWPQPHVLVHQAVSAEQSHDEVLRRSLLVDPASFDDRLWAIDLCLRSEVVTAVIADASEMRMAHSRRLQLAAESGRSLALLARPTYERQELSAAATRWRIEPTPSPHTSPRWRVELVRCKGVQRGRRMDAADGNPSTLVLEHDHAAHCLRAVADVADRSRAPEASPAAQRISIRRTG